MKRGVWQCIVTLMIIAALLSPSNAKKFKKLKKIKKPSKPSGPPPTRKPTTPNPTKPPTTRKPTRLPTKNPTKKPTATVWNSIEKTFREATCSAEEDYPLWNGLAEFDLSKLAVFQSVQSGEVGDHTVNVQSIFEHQFCTELVFAAMNGAVLQSLEPPLNSVSSVLNAIPFGIGDRIQDEIGGILEDIFGSQGDIRIDDVQDFIDKIQQIAKNQAYKLCNIIYGDVKKDELVKVAAELQSILSDNGLDGINGGEFTVSARYGGKFCFSETAEVCMSKSYGVAVNGRGDVEYTESRGIELVTTTTDIGIAAKQFGDVHFYANIDDVRGRTYAIGPSIVIPGLGQMLEEKGFDRDNIDHMIEMIQQHIGLIPSGDAQKIIKFMAVLLQKTLDGGPIGFCLNFGVDSFALSDVLSLNCEGVLIDQVNAANTVAINFKREKSGGYKKLELGMTDYEFDTGIDNTLTDIKAGIAVAEEIYDLLKKPVKAAVAEVTQFFDDLFDKIKDGFNDAIDAIIGPLKDFGINSAEALKDFGEDIARAFKAIGITTKGGILSVASQFKKFKDYWNTAAQTICPIYRSLDSACDKLGHIKDKVKKKVPNGGKFCDSIGLSAVKSTICDLKNKAYSLARGPCGYRAESEPFNFMDGVDDDIDAFDFDYNNESPKEEEYYLNVTKDAFYFYATIGCIAAVLFLVSVLMNVYWICFRNQYGVKYSAVKYDSSAYDESTDADK